ncbi:hypothetical protein LTS18_012484 [Coniosporium uncinatum]|uniref:Uncharacterized protein n=1 Tax=Coniosporium uncinatum TaxID=93489 RepID=A0ACC3DJI1_9PEZI|nr:hypothetical protein LTS18_012484 [Coniosporium uncinatum]
MSYVPPALRNKENQPSQIGKGPKYKAPLRDLRNEKLYAVGDLHAHFWPSAGEVKQVYNEADGTKTNTFALDFKNRHHGTLDSSEATPNKLAYVVLFGGANPRWDSDNIIFVKTNLELLPPEAEEKSSSPDAEQASTPANSSDIEAGATEHATTTPSNAGQHRGQCSSSFPFCHRFANLKLDRYAASTSRTDSTSASDSPHRAYPGLRPSSRSSRSNSARNMAFTGYYRIVRIARLAPHSPELVEMLEQKWEPPKNKWGKPVRAKTRDPAAWEASMKQAWAVVKFERDRDATVEVGAPNIKLREEEEEGAEGSIEGASGEKKKKNVKEMLQKLRLAQSNKEH